MKTFVLSLLLLVIVLFPSLMFDNLVYSETLKESADPVTIIQRGTQKDCISNLEFECTTWRNIENKKKYAHKINSNDLANPDIQLYICTEGLDTRTQILVDTSRCEEPDKPSLWILVVLGVFFPPLAVFAVVCWGQR